MPFIDKKFQLSRIELLAFSSSECSSVAIETQFRPFPRLWFFNCLKMPPKWDEEKIMKGKEKWKNGEDVFRVTE